MGRRKLRFVMAYREKFLPIEEILVKGRFECETIVDGVDGLSISVRDYEGDFYNLYWDGGVVSYRNTDEGDRIGFVSEIASLSLIGFLIVECVNSKYLKWLHAEKCGIEQENLRHFIVMTSNDIIDVIDYDVPVVSKVNS
ncbi:hypothetical protein [Brucella sp. NBRC 12950]|uniref:hypothetical protein n=1 Tax=Brucella sp. NBRC 12950 TaxID=2994518 RepID=UPI00255703E7|nr:hypothetical protein [Brucella sp. NBRC 12950]